MRLKDKIDKNLTLINVIFSIVLQVITLISGFIIPKIILIYFGSEVNGLVSSLAKFLSYISIIEGGIIGVVMASLYKPLHEGNKEKLNRVLKTTQDFYKKIAFIFILYSLALAIIYPILIKTQFCFSYIFTLCLIMAIGVFIQYNFSITFKTFLSADKKVYVVAAIQIIITILNIILCIIIVKLFPNIHVLKIISVVLFAFQPIMFNYYIKKNYNINIKTAKGDDELLKSRWDGFAINMAGFIHTNTDILILTLFTNLSIVSIYSVYALVVSGLRALIVAVSNAIKPIIGRLYIAGSLEKLNKRLDIYEYIIFILVYLTFSVACLLITPFVLIYTNGIDDAFYNQPVFGVIILIAEGIYLLKLPHLDLAYSANKFKQLSKPAYTEVIINIIISIVLVNKYGLVGISIGTVIAMLYRTIFQVYFSKKLIGRSIKFFIKKVIIFTGISILDIWVCLSMSFNIQTTIKGWVFCGLIYTIIFLFSYFIISLIFFRSELSFLKNYFNKNSLKEDF